MLVHQFAMPWAPSRDIYCMPGSLVVKFALGEVPEEIPTMLDVRAGLCEPCSKLGQGPVDRILRQHTSTIRIARVHSPAADPLTNSRLQHQQQIFTDLEHALGLSRTLRIDVDINCSIDNLVSDLQQIQSIEMAMPSYLSTIPFQLPTIINNFSLDEAWESRAQVNAAQALAYEAGDPAVILAVLDTGVRNEHPELRNRIRRGFDTVELGAQNFSTGIQVICDSQNPDAYPIDEVGHGTACTGIVAALGSKLPVGLAGNCSNLPIRVLGSVKVPSKPVPVGVGVLSDIDAGIKRAIDLGAKVLNLSFGTPENSLSLGDSRPHEDVIKYGLTRGCMFVAAGGNSGKEERYLPAALEDVIAVGSVDSEGNPSRFNSRGNHIDLCAPGEQVITTGLDGYQKVTGSSFAAPFVTAATALLISRARRRAYPLSSSEVGRLLRDTAQPWSYPQIGQGVGVLDMLAALKALDLEIDLSSTHQKTALLKERSN